MASKNSKNPHSVSKIFQIIHFWPKNTSQKISHHKASKWLCRLFLRFEYKVILKLSKWWPTNSYTWYYTIVGTLTMVVEQFSSDLICLIWFLWHFHNPSNHCRDETKVSAVSWYWGDLQRFAVRWSFAIPPAPQFVEAPNFLWPFGSDS